MKSTLFFQIFSKRIVSIFALLCLASNQLAADTPSTNSNATHQNVLVLGDSLSAGYGIDPNQAWPSLLDNYFEQHDLPFNVVNASISGDTTAGGLARIAPLLTQHQPSIIILELGANDGLRGLSLNAMTTNLTAIINQSKQANSKVLLIGNRLPPNYGRRFTEAFYQSYAKLAKAQQLPLMPFMLQDVAGNPKLMQADGLHPNATAQPIILKNILRYLTPLLTPQGK